MFPESRNMNVSLVVPSGRVSVADSELDIAMREAAFQRVRLLNQMYGTIPAAKLSEGFEFRGQRVPLIDPGR
jgi:hypothetical protein